MQITHIDARNFLGLPRFSLAISSTLVCVCGANGAGKSSLIDAIRFALEGTVNRGITLKRDYDRMVSEGSSGTSYAAVTLDSGVNYRRNTKDGKLAKITGEPLNTDNLHFSIDTGAFARLDMAKRRTYLFDLMKVKFDGASVKAELAEEGIPTGYIEEIMPVLRGGFPGAADYADAQLVQKRADWRSLTGSATYGKKIAEEWAAEVPDPVDDADFERAEKVVRVAQGTVDATNEAINRGNLERSQRAAAIARQLSPEALEELRQALADAEAAFTGLSDDLAAAKVKAAGPSGTSSPCPCCGVLLTIDGGKLVENKTGGVPAGPADKARVDELQRQYNEAAAVLPSLRTKLATAESNAGAELPDAPGDETMGQLSTRLAEQRIELDGARAAVRILERAQDLRNQAETLTANARLAHEAVGWWEKVRDLMLPPGIPGRRVAKAIGPLNKRLQGYADATGWGYTQILPDMTVLYRGREYGLCSESEQWRAETMLAAAIAQQSGTGILVLDRMDVLEPAARGQLWGWLLADFANWGTVIVAGTLKAPPTVLAEQGVQVVWLDDTTTTAAQAA